MPVQGPQGTEQLMPVVGQVCSASSEGQSCSHWRGLVRRRVLELHQTPPGVPALPGCWHTWRTAALCPMCPAGAPEQPGTALTLPVLLQLVLLCPEHRAGSLHSVLVSPGCRGCHLSWPVCTPCKSTAESMTPGGSRRGSSSAWVNEWHP